MDISSQPVDLDRLDALVDEPAAARRLPSRCGNAGAVDVGVEQSDLAAGAGAARRRG